MDTVQKNKYPNHFANLRRYLFALLILALAAFLLTGTALAWDDLDEPKPLETKHTDWMWNLPDTMQISQINLPGTHDSTTYRVWFKGSAQTVLNSITEQLEAGIRYFDIRLRDWENDDKKRTEYQKLLCCHGSADCYKSTFTVMLLDDVLSEAQSFICNHPYETVVMYVCAESGRDNIERAEERISGIIDSHWHGNEKKPAAFPNVISYKMDERVPTLGEVRGKVILIYCAPGGKEALTNYEDNYEWYGDNEIDAGKKWELLWHHLRVDDSKQIYYNGTDTFKEDKNADGSRKRNKVKNNYAVDVYAPMKINTNLTQIHDKASWAKKMGPCDCWKYLYWSTYAYPDSFKRLNLNPTASRPYNQRTGWWAMDFPQDHQVQQIIDSNYTQIRYLDIDIRGPFVKDLKVKVTLSNGVELQPHIKAYKPYSQTDGLYEFRYGSYPASETVKDVTITADGYHFILLGKDIKENPKGTVVENATYHYQMIDRSEVVEVPIKLTWVGDYDKRYNRPAPTPEAFLQKVGEPVFMWKDASGNTRRIQISKTGADAGSLTKVEELNVYDWRLTFTLPKYNEEGREIQYSFDGMGVIWKECPYVVHVYGVDCLYLRLRYTEDKEWDEVNMLWIDGGDKNNMRWIEKNTIKGGTVHHTAYDSRTGAFVYEEDLHFGPESLRFNENDRLEALVRCYTSDYHLIRHEYELPKSDGVYTIEYSEEPNIRPQEIKLKLNATVMAYVEWDDSGDILGKRPDCINLQFRDLSTGMAANMTMDKSGGGKSQSPWYGATVCDAFEDGPKGSEINFPAGFTLEGVPADYECTVATCSKHQSGERFEFHLTFKVKGINDYTNINGNIIWNDGDLTVDHKSLNPDIRVRQNGEEMTLKDSVLQVNADRSKYGFVPITDFPNYMPDKTTPYQYAVDPQPLPGYIASNSVLYDVLYTRTVAVGGEVAWSGTRPTQAQPTVVLMRNGEPAGESMLCDNDAYLFENLPIAGPDGVPYQYSIEAFLPDYDCIVMYSTVERDAGTGNFRANATLVAPEHPVTAAVPVKLHLDGIDPNEVTDEFTFELTCEDDPEFEPLILKLSRDNGFEGAFEIEDINDSTRREYSITQINLDRYPSWIYDDSIQSAAVQLRFIADPVPVAEVDMDGKSALEYTNVYTGDVPIEDITIYLNWSNAERYGRAIPDSVDVTLFQNGSKYQTVQVSAADDWKCVFKDMPEYDVIPANSEGRRLKYITYTVDSNDVEYFVRTVTREDQKTFMISYDAIEPLPQTGDKSNPALLIGALLASLGLAAFVTLKRFRSTK